MPSLARLSEAVLGEMAGAVAGNLSCVVSNTTTDGEVNILCSNGIEYAPYHSHTLKPGTTQFWINVGICVLLILLAGVFSGLTLGLLSYDPNTLKVIMEGGKPAQAKSAKAVLPLVRHHHLLLVTLLLCNAGVNESLPLFLDDLVPSPIYAILISVTAVLMFGEVIPQALCSKHGLRIGSFFSPFVWFLIAVTFPLSYPLSRLLDLLLGADHSAFFRRAELGALVQIHGEDQVHNEGPSCVHPCMLSLRQLYRLCLSSLRPCPARVCCPCVVRRLGLLSLLLCPAPALRPLRLPELSISRPPRKPPTACR